MSEEGIVAAVDRAATGISFASVPYRPWGSILNLAAALGMCGLAGVFGSVHWAIGSVPFFLVAAALLATRPKPFAARCTSTHIEVQGQPAPIAYASVEGLRAGKRPANLEASGPRCYPMQIIHPKGVVSVPARLDAPSDELYRLLIQQFSPSGSRAVDPILRDYLAHQEIRYGASKVLIFRARTYLRQDANALRIFSVFLCVLLTGIVSVVVGSSLGVGSGQGWSVTGFLFIIIGFFFSGLFAFYIRPQRVPAKLRNASLIITPGGLGLVQGDTKGEMRWSELRGVDLSHKHLLREGRVEALRGGIQLTFAGASIIIGDIYDRPISMIYQAMDRYRSEY